MEKVFLLRYVNALALIISVTAQRHPYRLLMMRYGRSVTPAIGARMNFEGNIRDPMVNMAGIVSRLHCFGNNKSGRGAEGD
jgi:hypothetical protein